MTTLSKREEASSGTKKIKSEILVVYNDLSNLGAKPLCVYLSKVEVLKIMLQELCKIECQMKYFRSMLAMLNNPAHVKYVLNLKMEDIWEEFLWLSNKPPFYILKCAEITIPETISYPNAETSVMYTNYNTKIQLSFIT